MNQAVLATLRDRHPAWPLRASLHAPLVASFLHQAFVAPNGCVTIEADLATARDDQLFSLLEQLGPGPIPRRRRSF